MVSAANASDLIGSVLSDRYRIVGIVGDGGMGRVYAAEHVTLRRKLAIKVLKPELAQHEANVERFLQEARAASMIAHPNVVDILDFGQIPGGPVFFAMEFLEGEDLSELLRRLGRLPWPRVQPILLQVVRGLAAAHQCGVIHRDMKPANIFLVQRGDAIDQVKLLDFGIAKVTLRDRPGRLTGEGSVFGTARYMSPEQAAGLPVDARSDVYAVGILAYEMLSGRVPFDSDNFMRVATQHMNDPVPPLRSMQPDVDPIVDSLVMRALAKGLEDRYPSMAELEAAILAASFEATVAIANPLSLDALDRTTIYDPRRAAAPPAVASRSLAPAPADATVVRPRPRRSPSTGRALAVGSAPPAAPLVHATPAPAVLAPARSLREQRTPFAELAAPTPPPIFDHPDHLDHDEPRVDRRDSTGEFLAPVLPTGMLQPSTEPVTQHTLPPVNWQGGNPATFEHARATEGAETHEFALTVPRREVSRNGWVIGVAVATLLMVCGGGMVWFFLLRDDADATEAVHPVVVAGEPRPTTIAAPPEPAAEPAPPPPTAPQAQPPPPKARHASPPARERTEASPPPPRDRLDASAIDRGFGKVKRAIKSCGQTHGAVSGTSFAVDFDVDGGRAIAVSVQRPWDVTPLGRCVADAVRRKTRFPAATSGATHATRQARF